MSFVSIACESYSCSNDIVRNDLYVWALFELLKLSFYYYIQCFDFVWIQAGVSRCMLYGQLKD